MSIVTPLNTRNAHVDRCRIHKRIVINVFVCEYFAVSQVSVLRRRRVTVVCLPNFSRQAKRAVLGDNQCGSSSERPRPSSAHRSAVACRFRVQATARAVASNPRAQPQRRRWRLIALQNDGCNIIIPVSGFNCTQQQRQSYHKTRRLLNIR